MQASKQASNMTDDRLGSYFLILPTRWVFSLPPSFSLSLYLFSLGFVLMLL